MDGGGDRWQGDKTKTPVSLQLGSRQTEQRLRGTPREGSVVTVLRTQVEGGGPTVGPRRPLGLEMVEEQPEEDTVSVTVPPRVVEAPRAVLTPSEGLFGRRRVVVVVEVVDQLALPRGEGQVVGPSPSRTCGVRVDGPGSPRPLAPLSRVHACPGRVVAPPRTASGTPCHKIVFGQSGTLPSRVFWTKGISSTS